MVARGAIPFASVAAVIKIYFLLRASCVRPCLAARGGGSRLGLQVVVGGAGLRARAGPGQVELPGSQPAEGHDAVLPRLQIR